MAAAPYDVLIVGGGPAGLAAAAEAAAAGLSVCLVDERPTLGGQIFKQPGPGFRVTDPKALGSDFLRGRGLIDAAERSGARLLLRTSAISIRETAVVVVEEGERAHTLSGASRADRSGRPRPPGRLSRLDAAGRDHRRRRTDARQDPARASRASASSSRAAARSRSPSRPSCAGTARTSTAVLEAGPAPGVARRRSGSLAAARGNTTLLRDAVAYRTALLARASPFGTAGSSSARRATAGSSRSSTPPSTRDWRPVAGQRGTDRGRRALSRLRLLPLRRAPSARRLRLRLRRGPRRPRRDRGRVAAHDAAGNPRGRRRHRRRRVVRRDRRGPPRRARRGARPRRARGGGRGRAVRRRSAGDCVRSNASPRALRRLHRVGQGIYELSTPETIVCRCEEVTSAQLDEAIEATDDLNVVKTLTRTAMGLCQGRNCQRHVGASIARHHGRPLAELPVATPRPPVRPVPIGGDRRRLARGRGLLRCQVAPRARPAAGSPPGSCASLSPRAPTS